MLRRSKRVAKELFNEVLAKGIPYHGTYCTMRVLRKTAPLESRFSVVLPKKIAKTAVERNAGRRRVTAALEKLYGSLLLPVYCIIFIKRDISVISFADIIEDVRKTAIKAGLIA